MNDYLWYNDGQGIEKDILDITKKYSVLESTNKTLREENKRLKDEHYKDLELQRLREENETLKKSLTRGFPISQDQSEKIQTWLHGHSCPYRGTSIGPGVSEYRFDIIPGIGYNGYAKCRCGDEFCFYEE